MILEGCLRIANLSDAPAGSKARKALALRRGRFTRGHLGQASEKGQIILATAGMRRRAAVKSQLVASANANTHAARAGAFNGLV